MHGSSNKKKSVVSKDKKRKHAFVIDSATEQVDHQAKVSAALVSDQPSHRARYQHTQVDDAVQYVDSAPSTRKPTVAGQN